MSTTCPSPCRARSQRSHQHDNFFVAADEWRQMALPGAASAAARPHDSVKRHRRRHALQFVVTKLLGYEHTRYLAQARRSGCAP
jgi:hypothetical protein